MPDIYVFDAVRTILKPVPDVVSAYFEAGQRHGSQLNREQVAARFKEARRKHFGLSQSATDTVSGSLVSSDDIETKLWRQLIFEVFVDIANPDELFQQLWRHFASAENWALYPDVAECFNRLHRTEKRIIIASNFDSRLNAIVNQFNELSSVAQVFCSAEVGYRKPDPMFYQFVADSAGLGNDDEVLMVGDDYENDYVAPKRFGWRALHLDRLAACQQVGVIQSLAAL